MAQHEKKSSFKLKCQNQYIWPIIPIPRILINSPNYFLTSRAKLIPCIFNNINIWIVIY